MMTTQHTREVTGEYVRLDDEEYYRISNCHLMPDFFMSLVGASDHWMFISSRGALTAGRRNSDFSLFQYTSDDQISAQRRQELEATLTEVGRMMDTLKDRYEPFMSDLRDIELVLANDLSVGGIRVAEPIINAAIEKAAETRNAVDSAERALASAIAAFER